MNVLLIYKRLVDKRKWW